MREPEKAKRETFCGARQCACCDEAARIDEICTANIEMVNAITERVRAMPCACGPRNEFFPCTACAVWQLLDEGDR